VRTNALSIGQIALIDTLRPQPRNAGDSYWSSEIACWIFGITSISSRPTLFGSISAGSRY